MLVSLTFVVNISADRIYMWPDEVEKGKLTKLFFDKEFDFIIIILTF